ncbi:hypothetical protein BGZ99_001408 [Dissophora globulifera]|uniref:Uncharacterized protein n=1 Tax=Dissophora globulifera TaxID=979702 RepID=A0A9P6R2J5_9FUNG|nr:hypothetical protein BGZ99_001408 [Dissophora globulifera]
MAPSLPGSRRSATKGSSSSSTSMKREGSFRREARSTRAPSKQDSDSEDQSRGSPSGSRRPARKASSRSKSRPVEEEDLDDDNSENETGNDDDGTEEGESAEPTADLEENEGEVDEAGETKITKNGELLGGRQYKCRSFKLPDRGDRIYMLSMDPARVLGFRDSYLFFLKNPQLVRVNTTVEERQWMIENGMLMANFKSKLIAVVTARSIFKSFGARIIKNGRGRVDDYYEANATEDDLLDESEGDGASRAGDDQGGYGQNEPASGSAASKRKLMHEEMTRQVTDLNWQYESAMAVRALNSRLRELRKENPRFLDPHTNIEQVPALLQPSQCKVKTAPSFFAQAQARTKATSGSGSDNATSVPAEVPAVIMIPRSIGPVTDASVRVEIKAGVPPPPLIHDSEVWAAIPEDTRQALEDIRQAFDDADAANAEDDDDGEQTKYPISILAGQYQASYPIHQARFQQPYRIVLPQSMGPQAQFIHNLWTAQARHP